MSTSMMMVLQVIPHTMHTHPQMSRMEPIEASQLDCAAAEGCAVHKHSWRGMVQLAGVRRRVQPQAQTQHANDIPQQTTYAVHARTHAHIHSVRLADGACSLSRGHVMLALCNTQVALPCCCSSRTAQPTQRSAWDRPCRSANKATSGGAGGAQALRWQPPSCSPCRVGGWHWRCGSCWHQPAAPGNTARQPRQHPLLSTPSAASHAAEATQAYLPAASPAHVAGTQHALAHSTPALAGSTCRPAWPHARHMRKTACCKRARARRVMRVNSAARAVAVSAAPAGCCCW